MDLSVPVGALSPRQLQERADGEASLPIRTRVIAARNRQLERDGRLNVRLEGRSLRARVRLDSEGGRLLDKAITRLALSARGFDRVLRVARTIADLDASDSVSAGHLGEALQFRGEG